MVNEVVLVRKVMGIGQWWVHILLMSNTLQNEIVELSQPDTYHFVHDKSILFHQKQSRRKKLQLTKRILQVTADDAHAVGKDSGDDDDDSSSYGEEYEEKDEDEDGVVEDDSSSLLSASDELQEGKDSLGEEEGDELVEVVPDAQTFVIKENFYKPPIIRKWKLIKNGVTEMEYAAPTFKAGFRSVGEREWDALTPFECFMKQIPVGELHR